MDQRSDQHDRRRARERSRASACADSILFHVKHRAARRSRRAPAAVAAAHQSDRADSTHPAGLDPHIADSLQLLELAPEAKPGSISAPAPASRAGDRLRARRHAGRGASGREQPEEGRVPARTPRARASGHCARQRIEDLRGRTTRTFDVVTARALAPLDKLLGYAHPLLKRGAGLFPKGQDVEAELTAASKSWTIEADLIPSKTDPHGRIVRLRRAREALSTL